MRYHTVWIKKYEKTESRWNPHTGFSRLSSKIALMLSKLLRFSTLEAFDSETPTVYWYISMAGTAVETESDDDKKYVQESRKEKDKTKAWLSAELRLDDFNVKNQSFSITGWINVRFHQFLS